MVLNAFGSYGRHDDLRPFPLRRPACGQQLVRIAYGYPFPEDFERDRAGEIALGGCVVSPDRPTHVCLHCDSTFGRLEDDSESLGGAAFVSFPATPED